MLSAAKQVPERHLELVVGGPQVVPFLSPQRLSVTSHTPDWQTRVPFATVHTPLTGAVAGRGCPLAVFVAHTPAAHHSVPAAQSTSVTQPAPHAPDTVSHLGPPGWPTQSGSVVHFPHDPTLPAVKQ